MASYVPSEASQMAHEVDDIEDTNNVMRAAKAKKGVVRAAGVETGLGSLEQMDEGPAGEGLSGGDNFCKNNANENGKETLKTDRGTFDLQI